MRFSPESVLRFGISIALVSSGIVPVQANTISSVDGAVVATVTVSGGVLTYSVSSRGVTVVESSPLGLIVNNTNIGSGVLLGGFTAYTNNVNFSSRHGIHSDVAQQFSGQRINVSHAASGIGYVLNVAVFSNGAAFRYEFKDGVSRNVTGESTGFTLPASSTAWYQTGTSDYQGIYVNSDITALATNTALGPPVTVQLAGTNGFLALTEASLGAFSNPYLLKSSNAPGRQLAVAYPTNQSGTIGSTLSATVTNTPWHVIMIGSDLNALVNNDMVESLSPAPDSSLFPQGAATSWISSGRSVWDYLNPQPGGITYTNAMTNSYWASQMGFEFNTIDEGWGNWNGGNPWSQVQAVAGYSHARGVKIILWKTGSELSTKGQRSAFFQQLTNAGVDGIKADFFDFNSVSAAAKERVQLQESILREAAAYKLLVSFHGTSKPTGQFRTYPNLLQFEGVFGKEQYPGPYSESIPAFGRMLAGPADFTPLALQGGLSSGRTKAFEIATVIAMPGPIITLAERSDVIANSPFCPLIKSIPAMWDETIVLPQSQVGQTTAFARRKGTDWFVSVMNVGTARSWNIPLGFLDPDVTYQATIIRDTSNLLEAATVTQTNSLSVSAAAAGGIVAWFYQSPTNVYQPPTNTLAAQGIIDFEQPFYFLGNVADSTAAGATNAQFMGQQGWSQSTSGGRGAIVITANSGLYVGSQALGSGDSANAYIGANTNVVLGRKFRFDLLAPSGNKAGVAGFCDLNHDGMFSQAESGVSAGVFDISGVSYFGFRDSIAGGTTYSSGIAATAGNWYRVTVMLEDATRTATMDVSNLTAGGAVVDLNGGVAGTSFSHTWSSAQWISPTNFNGIVARASGTLLIDNIVVLLPPIDLPVTLQAVLSGTDLQLSWPRGILLEATNVSGPWMTNAGASPFSVTPSEPQKFYRILAP